MAEEPIVCDTKPLALEVEAGTYYWCACGRSAGQPFCDGAQMRPRSSRCGETESSMREKEFCELAEEEAAETIGGWMVL